MSKRVRKAINYAEPDIPDEESDGGVVEVKQKKPQIKRHKVAPAQPASTLAAPNSIVVAPEKSEASDKVFGAHVLEVKQKTQSKRRNAAPAQPNSTSEAAGPVVVAPKIQKGNKRKKKDETFFDFLQLPGEIRNMIYEYTFTSVQTMEITLPYDVAARRSIPDGMPYRHRLAEVKRSKKKKNDVPFHLLQTCKQIYTEATPFLYTNNVFHFLGSTALRSFMVHFPKAVPHLRNIQVPMDLDTSHGRAPDCQFVLDNLADVPLESLLTSIHFTEARTLEEASEEFHAAARNLIKAIGRRENNKLAALDLLEIRTVRIRKDGYIYADKIVRLYGMLYDLIHNDEDDAQEYAQEDFEDDQDNTQNDTQDDAQDDAQDIAQDGDQEYDQLPVLPRPRGLERALAWTAHH